MEPINLKDKNFLNLAKNDLKCEFGSLIKKTNNSTSTISSPSTTTTTATTTTIQTSKFLSIIISDDDENLISQTLSQSLLIEDEEEELAQPSVEMSGIDSLNANNSYYIVIGCIFGLATIILSVLLLIYTIYVKKFDSYYEKSAQKLAQETKNNSKNLANGQQAAYFDLSYLQKDVSTATNTTSNSNSSIIELFRKNYNEKSIIDPNQYLVSQLNDKVFNNFINLDSIKNSKVYNGGNGNILIIPNNTSSISSCSNSTASSNLAYPHLSTLPYDYYDSTHAMTNYV